MQTVLFTHHPLFRLLSPPVSGSLVYILILLIHNNVGQIEEQFLGQELYVCIGLSYLIQEFSRLFLILFRKLQRPKELWLRTSLQAALSLILCIVLVSAAIHTYYLYVLGFLPTADELLIFNGIFSTVTLIYLSLQLSHQFLYAVNTEKMEGELLRKAEIEEAFQRFNQGINPALLFESLEELIVRMQEDEEKAEELIDHLAAVYRYVLARRQQELVPVEEEIQVLEELIHLFNQLPYQQIALEIIGEIQSWILPTVLLYLVEKIIRSTIVSPSIPLTLRLGADETHVMISYLPKDRLHHELSLSTLASIQHRYRFYSKHSVFVEQKGGEKIIGIPILT